MQEHLYGESLTPYPLPQQAVTDMVILIPTVPVYFIHSFEQPFCAETTCTCHAQQQEVVRLFVKIIEGHFELEQAVNLIQRERAEGER